MKSLFGILLQSIYSMISDLHFREEKNKNKNV